MKIKLLVIGKTKKPFLVDGENEYLKRLAKYIPFEKIEIPDLKNAKNLSESQLKIEEGKLILAKLDKTGPVILLDERGKTYSSVAFAKWLQDEMNKGHKTITFVVGGPYGFSDEVYQAAQGRLSLSGMTLSHQMIRLFFIEQVYRAYAILNGDPYHHE